MADSSAEESSAESGPISTRAYLRIVFLDPVSLVGLGLVAVGLLGVALSTPGAAGPLSTPLVPAVFALLGAFVFALGYTRAQHELVRDRPDGEARNASSSRRDRE